MSTSGSEGNTPFEEAETKELPSITPGEESSQDQRGTPEQSDAASK